MTFEFIVFPFFTMDHFVVTIKHEDGYTFELTPDEADQFADMLRSSASTTRKLQAKEGT